MRKMSMKVLLIPLIKMELLLSVLIRCHWTIVPEETDGIEEEEDPYGDDLLD